MKDLIEALTIFEKYQKSTKWPTGCEHDVLYIMGVGKDDPSTEEKERLEALGFIWIENDESWGSYRFGSA